MRILLLAVLLWAFTAEAKVSTLSNTAVYFKENRDSLFIALTFDQTPALTPHFEIETPPSVVIEMHNTKIQKPFAPPAYAAPVIGVQLVEEDIGNGRWLTKAQILLTGKTPFSMSQTAQSIILSFALSSKQAKDLKTAGSKKPEKAFVTLESFSAETFPDKVDLTLNFSRTPPKRVFYWLNNPPRVFFELRETRALNKSRQTINIPPVKSLQVIPPDPSGPALTKLFIETKKEVKFFETEKDNRLTLSFLRDQETTPVSKKPKLARAFKKKWVYVTLGALALGGSIAGVLMGGAGEGSGSAKDGKDGGENEKAGGDGPPSFPGSQ